MIRAGPLEHLVELSWEQRRKKEEEREEEEEAGEIEE